jgi:hypothetical protein
MVTPKQCYTKYGEPGTNKANAAMVLWDVPQVINDKIPTIPNKIYCNKDLVLPLESAFRNLINSGCYRDLKTWDGCYNIRKQRGSLLSMSLHSWGVAVDLNAAWNGLGKQPQLSAAFVQCFTSAGFDWGGDWRRKDGMHFQLKMI